MALGADQSSRPNVIEPRLGHSQADQNSELEIVKFDDALVHLMSEDRTQVGDSQTQLSSFAADDDRISTRSITTGNQCTCKPAPALARRNKRKEK